MLLEAFRDLEPVVDTKRQVINVDVDKERVVGAKEALLTRRSKKGREKAVVARQPDNWILAAMEEWFCLVREHKTVCIILSPTVRAIV